VEQNNPKNYSLLCPCKSGELYATCCKPYLEFFYPKDTNLTKETSLTDWFQVYSLPICEAFLKKASSHVFRISKYLDSYYDKYLGLGFSKHANVEEDSAVLYLKHNMLLTLFASISCLSQGLFIQSGTLLRTLCEDCMLLLDIFNNPHQLESLLANEYTAKGLVSRVKKYLPVCVIRWYGYFSANFTHPAQIRTAPIMPNACYGDNWILVTGLQNITRVVCTFHIVLERVHYDEIAEHCFWKKDSMGKLAFIEDNEVFGWYDRLGEEIVKQFPPNERMDGFLYTDKSYELKS